MSNTSTAISIPPHTLAQIEKLAKRWGVSSLTAFEAVIGDESTWQAIASSGRLPPASMGPGRLGHVDHVLCRNGHVKCPRVFRWRGEMRCGCVTKTVHSRSAESV